MAEFFEPAALPDFEKRELCEGLLREFGVTRWRATDKGELIHSCPIPGGHRNGDKNPSASLNYKKLTFNCLGCGTRGGLLFFIARCRGEDVEGVRSWLGEATGTGGHVMDLGRLMDILDALEAPDAPPPPIPRFSKGTLDPWRKWAIQHPYLTEPPPDGRGCPTETLEHFKIGYAPEYAMGGQSVQERIIIPLFWRGDLVGWQARRLDPWDEPKYKFCVPTDTEILTLRGWLTVDELTLSDRVASVDERGSLRYAPPLKINRFSYDGDLVKISTRNFEQLVTPNHRVWVRPQTHVAVEPSGGRGYHLVQGEMKRCPRCGVWKNLDEYPVFPSQRGNYCIPCWKAPALETQKELTPMEARDFFATNRGVAGWEFPVAAREFSGGDLSLGGPARAELYGWIASDGGVDPKRNEVRIYQSKPEFVKRIRRLLEQEGIEFTEMVREREHTGWFPSGFRAEWMGRSVREHVFLILDRSLRRHVIDSLGSEKQLPWDWLFLRSEEALALLEGFRMGDGSTWRPDSTSIGQKDRRVLDWIQALCVRLGIRTKLTRRTGSDDFWDLALCRRDSVLLSKSTRSKWLSRQPHSGEVWCPQTVDGTWVARRNGCVFITGNSPDFPRDRTLFGMHEHREALIVESPLSVLRHHHHQPDILATFGAQVTEPQLRLLHRYPKVTLWFDNDPAGWTTTAAVGEALMPFCEVWAVHTELPGDPADLDDATLQEVRAQAIPYAVWEPPRRLAG
jgi:hypothetical protein